MKKPIDRISAYRNCNLGVYDLKYLGQKKQKGSFGLDEFMDLKTKVKFLRLPGEGLVEARDRARLEFLHTGEVSGMVGIIPVE